MVRIDITDELVERLTARAKILELGFKSSTEAVNDAIRRRIEQFDSAIIHRKNVEALKIEDEDPPSTGFRKRVSE